MKRRFIQQHQHYHHTIKPPKNCRWKRCQKSVMTARHFECFLLLFSLLLLLLLLHNIILIYTTVESRKRQIESKKDARNERTNKKKSYKHTLYHQQFTKNTKTIHLHKAEEFSPQINIKRNNGATKNKYRLCDFLAICPAPLLFTLLLFFLLHKEYICVCIRRFVGTKLLHTQFQYFQCIYIFMHSNKHFIWILRLFRFVFIIIVIFFCIFRKKIICKRKYLQFLYEFSFTMTFSTLSPTSASFLLCFFVSLCLLHYFYEFHNACTFENTCLLFSSVAVN